MIDTVHLLPAEAGPRSNPVLFGIAAAIVELLPLIMPSPCPQEDARTEPSEIHGDDTSARGVADASAQGVCAKHG